MKKLLITSGMMIFLCLFVVHGTSAQQSLRVNLSDGTVIEIALEDIQKLTFDLTTNVEQYTKVINQLIKLKAYPNPARETVNLDYTLPSGGNVVLEIFNLAGYRLLSKSLGMHQEGEYKYIWNITGVPSGTYVCRIRQNDQMISEKIIVKK